MVPVLIKGDLFKRGPYSHGGQFFYFYQSSDISDSAVTEKYTTSTQQLKTQMKYYLMQMYPHNNGQLFVLITLNIGNTVVRRELLLNMFIFCTMWMWLMFSAVLFRWDLIYMDWNMIHLPQILYCNCQTQTKSHSCTSTVTSKRWLKTVYLLGPEPAGAHCIVTMTTSIKSDLIT